MTIVDKAVYSVKRGSLKNRQFLEYLNELQSEYNDLLFLCEDSLTESRKICGKLLEFERNV